MYFFKEIRIKHSTYCGNFNPVSNRNTVIENPMTGVKYLLKSTDIK